MAQNALYCYLFGNVSMACLELDDLVKYVLATLNSFPKEPLDLHLEMAQIDHYNGCYSRQMTLCTCLINSFEASVVD